jgi:hypothetical protein
MSTSEESSSIESKQSEPVVAPVEEPESSPSETKPVDAALEPASEPVASSKKRKKGAAPQLDEEGNPIKKVRAPFVYTDKRKQAFELCRQKRAETLAKKREAEKELKEKQKEVRSTMREIRGIMYKADAAPELINQHLSNTLHSMQSPTTKTSEPVLMEEEQAPTPAAMPQTQPRPEPAAAMAQAPAPAATSVRPPAMKRAFEEDEPVVSVGSMQVTERRVVHFGGPPPRMGTGAGNHAPFEGEDGYGEQQEEPDEQAMDEAHAEPTDEEVAVMYEQARMEAERRGMFNQRRESGKMMRPSHAAMFLDHAYVHTMGAHPSQLHTPHRGPTSHGGAGAGASASSNLVWL